MSDAPDPGLKNMDLLKTDDGTYHYGRTGVIVYLAGFGPGFIVHGMDLHCWFWACFVLGWGLTYSDKHTPRKLPEWSKREITGIILTYLGLCGHAYVLLNS